jgi:nucleotide-binding universal stress UspA family protein
MFANVLSRPHPGDAIPDKIKKILVPVEGAPTDEESLNLACLLAKRDRAEVLVLYVIEMRRNLPIDADPGPELERGELVLEKLQKLAAQLKYPVQQDLLQAREAGSAIVGEAVERGIDAIVMGVPFHQKFGEFCVESRALYVLNHAPCRVLLTREAFKNGTGKDESREPTT